MKNALYEEIDKLRADNKRLLEAGRAVLASIAWTTIAHSDTENGIMSKLPALRAAIAAAEGRE